jgi:hypothetical protein
VRQFRPTFTTPAGLVLAAVDVRRYLLYGTEYKCSEGHSVPSVTSMVAGRDSAVGCTAVWGAVRRGLIMARRAGYFFGEVAVQARDGGCRGILVIVVLVVAHLARVRE